MTALKTLANLRLQDPYGDAMQQALNWLPSVVAPVGVVVSGSIVRGNPSPSSDLDIVVLHDGQWRRRIQRWFNRVPVELFFNSPEWLTHCIHQEAEQGRPVMAHMLASGKVVHDSDERMAAIVETAREVLGRGPNLKFDALLRDRYAAACQVEDALDFEGADTPDGRQLLALAVDAIVRHAYLRENRFLPRPKERLAQLASTEPEVARLLSMALIEAPARATRALRQASERVLGTSGFFEWDSGPDSSPPPDRS